MTSAPKRGLAILLTLVCLLAVTSAPAPAQVQARLDLAPGEGPPGTVVVAAARDLPVGSDFRANLRFQDAPGWPDLASGVPITARGSFEIKFVVPKGFPAGDRTVELCVQRSRDTTETCDRMPTARFRVTGQPNPTTSTSAPTPTQPVPPTTVAPPTSATPPSTAELGTVPPPTTAIDEVVVSTTSPPPTFAVGELVGPTTTAGLGLGELTGNDAPDLRITDLEVTQGIQNLDNDMPLVAGRTTVVRVYARTDGEEMANVSAVLQLVRGSTEIAVLQPDNGPIVVEGGVPNRADPESTLNFTLPAAAIGATDLGGPLIVTAFVFGTHPTAPALHEPTDVNNYEAEVLEFHPTGEMTVHLLPMHMHEQPHPGAIDATYGTDPTDFFALAATIASLYRYHPVSGVNAVMGPTIYPPLHGLELDWLPTAMTEWDLTLDGVESSILGQVQDVWAETSSTNHLDQYYGIYREDLPREWGGFSNGTVAYGYYDLAFGDTTPWYHRAGWLAAHELGHSMGFAHVACKGTESNPGDYPWSDPCTLAPVDPAGYYGWDIRHDAFAVTDGPSVITQAPGLPPATNGYPFMGYQSSKWTDPWHYCRALVKLGVDCTAVAIPENEIGPTDGPDLAAPTPYQDMGQHDQWVELTAVNVPTASAADDPLTAVRFEISIDSAQVKDAPLPHVLDALAARRSAGTPSGLVAAVVDATGEVLAELELVETMTGGDPREGDPEESDTDIAPEDPEPVVTAMTDYLPWPDGAAALQLRVDGEPVAERRPSAHPPTVEVVAPSGGALAAPLTIEWAAADADGDDLAFDIAYSPDGGQRWLSVTSYLGGTSYTVDDPSLLAGGDEAVFRVTARDGFFTTTALSTPGVLADQPPEVLVVSPGDGASVPQHRAVTLLASGWDDEDSSSPEIQWSSDRDGPLGTGSQLVTAALSAGEHHLTATAVDAAGNTAAGRVTLFVDGDRALPRLDADGLDAARAALAAGPVRPPTDTSGPSGGPLPWAAGAIAVLAAAAAAAAVRRGRSAAPGH